MKGFFTFIREQGVVGLAVGFILGSSVSKVVTSLVTDIVNPLLGLLLGSTDGLRTTYLTVGASKIMYGNFLATMLDFLIIGFVIYYIVHVAQLDKIDKKKS
jgi:large conductance mechanosensitive channel